MRDVRRLGTEGVLARIPDGVRYYATIDFVEVAPDYDQAGSTAFLAAQFLMNVLGFIFHEKGRSA